MEKVNKMINTLPNKIGINVAEPVEIIQNIFDSIWKNEKAKTELAHFYEDNTLRFKFLNNIEVLLKQIQMIKEKLRKSEGGSSEYEPITLRSKHMIGYKLKRNFNSTFLSSYRYSKCNFISKHYMLYGEDMVFHRDFSHEKILRTIAKFQANLNSYEIDPYNGKQTTFFQKYLLSSQQNTFLSFLDKICNQFHNQIFSLIELSDCNREDVVVAL